jgi:uncharacterized membrane protein
MEWDAETTTDDPNRLIAWASLPGSGFDQSGFVRFDPAPGNRGTIVRFQIDYAPLGGAMAAAIARLAGADLESQLDRDLRASKQIIETGEIVKSDASIHRGMHAAQPPAGTTVAYLTEGTL